MDNKDLIALTRESKYIKSIFDPRMGPFSIPDEVSKRHVLRQETITANLPASKDGGIILYYPNSVGFYNGFHYTYDGDVWKLEQAITTAQDLAENYNYARQISGILDVRATTQSTSNAILSGNMNAATYEGGGISELNLQTATAEQIYKTILSSTSNAMDKVNGAYVANGLTILSVPNEVGTRYQRIDDRIPMTRATNSNTAVISDDDSSLVIYGEVPYVRFLAASSATPADPAQYLTVINVDSGVGKGFTIHQRMQVGTNQTLLVQARPLNMFGALCDSDYAPQDELITFVENIAHDFTLFVPPTKEPVASIAIRVRNDGDDASIIVQDKVSIQCHGCNLYGAAKPTTIVAYTGMIADSIITVSGVRNYELIPNSDLLRQMSTTYRLYDKHALDYLQMLLSARAELGIRTVMSYNTYTNLLRYFVELGDVDNTQRAEAFSLGKLVRGIKKVAVPALSAIFPAAAPIIGAASGVIDEILPDEEANAASGSLFRANAASGKVYKIAPGFQAHAASIVSDFDISDNDSDFSLVGGASTANLLNEHSITIGTPLAPRAAMFPVIITDKGVVKCVRMYAAIEGDHSDCLLPSARVTTSRKGKKIYGADSTIPYDIEHDYTLLPLQSVKDNTFSINGGPMVVGESWQAAVYLLESMRDFGIFKYPLTGAVAKDKSGRLVILSNPAINTKATYVSERGLKLIGTRSNQSNIIISTLIKVVNKNLNCDWAEKSIRPMDRNPSLLAQAMSSLNPSLEEIVEYGDRLAGNSESQGAEIQDVMSELDKSNTPNDVPVEKIIEDKKPPIPKPRRLIAPPRAVELEIFDQILDAENNQQLPEGSADVFKYLVNTGLMHTMHKMAKIDPNGSLVYRTLKPFYEITSKGEGRMSPAAAQHQRAQRLYATLMNQYRDITVDWIIQNGYRGPDDAQARYYRNQGVLPDPGTGQSSLLARPSNRDEALDAGTQALNFGGQQVSKLQTRLERLIANDSKMSEAMANQLRDFVDTNARMPSTDEIKQMREADVARGRKAPAKPGVPNAPQNLLTTAPPSNRRSNRLFLAMQRGRETDDI